MSTEVSFYLKSQKYVYYSVRTDDGIRCANTTKLKVQVLGDIQSLTVADKNILNRFKTHLDKYIATCRLAERPVYKPDIEQQVAVFFGSSNNTSRKTVGDIVRDYRDGAINGTILKEGSKSKYSASWVKLSKYANNALDMENRLKNKRIEDVRMSHINDFQSHLVKKGYSANSVAVYNNLIVSILRTCKRMGWHGNSALFEQPLQLAGEKVEYAISYNEEELSKLAAHNFEGVLEQTRDVFVFGCYTCLRHIDYWLTDYNTCISDEMIVLETEKTDSKIYIPLHPIAKQVLIKYDYNLPKIEYGNLNKYLKLMAAAAGFNEPCFFSRTQGGERVKSYKPKHELTTTHTMRRSFATNAYKSGMAIDTIMRLGGWKNVNTLERYLRIGGVDVAIMAKNSKFYDTKDKQPDYIKPLKKALKMKDITKIQYNRLVNYFEDEEERTILHKK